MGSVIVTYLVLFITSANICKAETHADSGYVGGRLMRVRDDSTCAVPAWTQAGWVCGTERVSYDGVSYASFRGVPYARQPIGELRFVAPQAVESWDGYFDASVEGPVCVQTNFLFGPLMQPLSMGEDCLRVNVHVPTAALPARGEQCAGAACLPVLVYVHGGGFQTGSGDSDMNGPEYMMDQNILLVTVNYRLGPFGFLSLNSSSVPGNTGLRDQVAALRWVQDNVRSFGGDPDRVTLMGQSAGASAVHLLSLSEATQGLFGRVILMSGTAGAGFYSTLPSYSQSITSTFLKNLGINSTDTEEIHRQLNELPYETILDVNSQLLDNTGLSSFNPVVESQFDEVTRILDEDPDVLVAQGRGNNYPLIIGWTNKECESLRLRLENITIVARIQQDITSVLPIKLLFSASGEVLESAAEQVMSRYFSGTPTMDEYLPACMDGLVAHPALHLAETRVATGGAPVYLYQFSYNSDFTAIKEGYGLNYTGAGHIEDLTYVLRVNSILGNTTLNTSDTNVKDWMTTIVRNFVSCSDPTCVASSTSWPAAARPLQYQDISGAAYAVSGLTEDQQTMKQLFDSFYQV